MGPPSAALAARFPIVYTQFVLKRVLAVQRALEEVGSVAEKNSCLERVGCSQRSGHEGRVRS